MRFKIAEGLVCYSPATDRLSRGISVSAETEIFCEVRSPEAHTLRQRGWSISAQSGRVIARKEEGNIRCRPENMKLGYERAGKAVARILNSFAV